MPKQVHTSRDGASTIEDAPKPKNKKPAPAKPADVNSEAQEPDHVDQS